MCTSFAAKLNKGEKKRTKKGELFVHFEAKTYWNYEITHLCGGSYPSVHHTLVHILSRTLL